MIGIKSIYMKKTGILIFTFFIFVVSRGQEDIFPADWLGTYTGEMYMIRAASDKIDTVSLQFDFLDCEKPNCWIYRMTYQSPEFGEIIKDYQLIKPDSLAVSNYLIDEKDGIFIELVKMGNSLYSNFSVGGQYLYSVMRKQENSILYEIVIADEKHASSSQNRTNGSDEIYQVKSFPPFSTQIAYLIKKQN